MKKEYDFAKAKRGAVVSPKGKTRIAIYLDTYVVDEFRVRADEAGYGYQTMINEALRQYLEKSKKPLDETVVRRVGKNWTARPTIRICGFGSCFGHAAAKRGRKASLYAFQRGLVLTSATFREYRRGARHSGRSGMYPGCR